MQSHSSRTQLNFRNGTPDDVPLIKEFEDLPGNKDLVGQSAVLTHMANLSHPDVCYLIAEAEGRPVGFVMLKGWTSKKVVYLQRIIVGERDKGWGRKILRALA